MDKNGVGVNNFLTKRVVEEEKSLTFRNHTR